MNNFIKTIPVSSYSLGAERICLGTEKSYGFEKISFSFSPEWSGLFKTVTFYPPKKKPISIEGLESGKEYDVPSEVTERGGIGEYVVSGYADGKKLYSVSGTFEVLSSRSEQGVAPAAPTPSEVDQIRQYALDAKLAAEEADIAYIKQTPSSEDGGENIVEIGLKNGETYKLVILNGSKGSKGDKGDRGDKGEKGDAGASGKDGFSPSVSVTAIDGGHQVDITDRTGTKTFSVMDGKDGAPGESPIMDIGIVPIYSYTRGWLASADATNRVTFKPTMAESYNKCYKPMSFRADELGSGTGDGYIFHNDYVYWDYYTLSFELYFHTFTASGEKKVVKLLYAYDDYDALPKSITAYLVEQETDVLFVTVADGKASHTSTEIAEYVNKGYTVYLRDESGDCALSKSTDYLCEFSFMDAEDQIAYTWEILEDGRAGLFETQMTTAQDLERSIGDIETALDGIITIQEALMVGNTEEVLDDLHEYAQNIIDGGDTA